MHCLSTRGGDSATTSAAISAGLARDGGLYLPALPLPRPGPAPDSLALDEVARWVLAPFFAGEPFASELPEMCRSAFTFDAPLRWLGERDGLLELFHGPTAAFKDFGARFLAECLARLPAPGGTRTRTVLVATSGDTGAAVAAAFHRRAGFRVVVLYPDGRVSARQAHQLGAFGDNVTTLRVQGSFDDCQRMVKSAFADAALRAELALTSANSISLGRLLPQIAYFARAALLSVRAGHAAPVFVVPTGNLGNAFACLMARELGLPIGHVALATNANRTLVDLIETGRYEPRASVATLANAMDVGAPSNVERLLAWFPRLEDLRATVSADSVDDDTIRERIRATWKRHAIAVCPHTACGLEVSERLRARGERGPIVVAATAHPAKFESIVEPAIGRAVEVPRALSDLLGRPARAQPIEAADRALRDFLITAE